MNVRKSLIELTSAVLTINEGHAPRLMLVLFGQEPLETFRLDTRECRIPRGRLTGHFAQLFDVQTVDVHLD